MLGGMSWESTALYYRLANELVRDRLGGLASADLLVRSVDFAQVRELQVQGRWDDAAAVELGAGRVGLAGAGATMAEPFYAERLARHGLDVVVPGAADRELLDRAIFDELCLGVLSEATRAALRGVLARLVDDGVDAVVLGCTELELLLTAADCAVPLLPTARLHVQAAVTTALAP